MVLHPLLFGAFFVLALYSASMRHFPLRVIPLPMAATLAGILIIWCGVRLLARDVAKSGMIVSLFTVMFFCYGYLLESVQAAGGIEFTALGSRWNTNAALFPPWSLILIIGVWLIAKTRRSLTSATKLANIFAGCFVLASVGAIVTYSLRSYEAGPQSSESASIDPGRLDALPNICYIVPDGYGRADVLADLYRFDNGPFLQYLTEKGFYVAAEARANYCQTALSQASTLNMKYLDGLAQQLGPDCDDRRPLGKMIRDCEVGRILKKCRYEIISFESGYAMTSDLSGGILRRPTGYLGELELALVDHTMLGPVLTKLRGAQFAFDFHRDRTLWVLDHLTDALDSERPVFAYAHIICPHPPFVFASDGGAVTPSHRFAPGDGTHYVGRFGSVKQYRERYCSQVRFMNNKLKAVIEDIQAKAKRPTIVIIQADHGPGSMLNWDSVEESNARERMGILSAYLFPDKDYSSLRPDTTPVNTFRVIFNQYFGGSYSMVDDKCFMSTWDRPYLFHRTSGDTIPDS